MCFRGLLNKLRPVPQKMEPEDDIEEKPKPLVLTGNDTRDNINVPLLVLENNPIVFADLEVRGPSANDLSNKKDNKVYAMKKVSSLGLV